MTTVQTRAIAIPSRILSGRPNRPCRLPSCPLNEAGIVHNVGVYKHNGRKNSLQGAFLFGEANPPEFIWQLAEKRAKALEQIRLGQDGSENWDVVVEMDTLLRRFCEIHAV